MDNKYILISESIQDMVDLHIISYEKGCEINDLAYDKYINEGSVQDTINNIKDKAKPAIDDMSKKYINGLNKRGDAVAKAVIKKPSSNASPDTVEKYNQKINNVKSIYKVGEYAAASAVLIGPFQWIITAAFINGIAKSDDPSDKKTVAMINNLKTKGTELKNKVTAFMNKINGKKITQQDKSEIDKFGIEGLNIAKQIDSVKRSVNVATESSNDFDLYGNYVIEMSELIYDCGELTESWCDVLSDYITKTDINDLNKLQAIDYIVNQL